MIKSNKILVNDTLKDWNLRCAHIGIKIKKLRYKPKYNSRKVVELTVKSLIEKENER